jgi:nicotinate-nucleotide pyrophosphorylase (carboxylating)
MLQNLDLEAAALDSAEHLIDLALAEDFGEAGDITTQAIFADGAAGKSPIGNAVIVAKSAGVAAGLKIVARIFQRVAPPVRVELLENDKLHRRSAKVARLYGPTASILAGERVAAEFLAAPFRHTTLTRILLKRFGANAKILDTRKPRRAGGFGEICGAMRRRP